MLSTHFGRFEETQNIKCARMLSTFASKFDFDHKRKQQGDKSQVSFGKQLQRYDNVVGWWAQKSDLLESWKSLESLESEKKLTRSGKLG